MIDPLSLLTAALAIPIILLFGFLGCAALAPFDEPIAERFPVRVQVRFPPPEGIALEGLRVTLDLLGNDFEGNHPSNYDDRNGAPHPDGEGNLLYDFDFPEMPAARYVVTCNVYGGPGDAIIATPAGGCVLLLSRDSAASLDLIAGPGESQFHCNGNG